MAILELQISALRCIRKAEIKPHPDLNLVVGGNGAGKTTVLEAIFLLGRGRSFRAPRSGAMIQNGLEQSTVFAQVRDEEGSHRQGVAIHRSGLEIRIDGNPAASVADLVRGLPVQLIDPVIHELVQGGPGERRRFLDWGVFHVKHEFRMAWSGFRRALAQRNAALRQGASAAAIGAWNSHLLAGGIAVDNCRRTYLDQVGETLRKATLELLGLPLRIQYRPGWSAGESFETALASSLERDRALGSTQVGPQRAELILEVEGQAARHRLSRGQQKLLAAALILGQSQFVMTATGNRLVLLVDEPAAELDAAHLGRLVGAVASSGAQVFMTALDTDAFALKGPASVFHVERGEVRILL